MTFETSTAGKDPNLGIPATLHKTGVLTDEDEEGSITMKVQGKSALVEDDMGNQVPGYTFSWTILSGTGAYADLRGQGKGYGWPDLSTWKFPVYLCGQGHYDPANQGRLRYNTASSIRSSPPLFFHCPAGRLVVQHNAGLPGAVRLTPGASD